MSVIAPEYIHAVFINDSRVTVPGCGCRARIPLDFLPNRIIHIVFVKIVHSVEPIVAPKNVDRTIMHN
jgi:hypothetical protein